MQLVLKTTGLFRKEGVGSRTWEGRTRRGRPRPQGSVPSKANSSLSPFYRGDWSTVGGITSPRTPNQQQQAGFDPHLRSLLLPSAGCQSITQKNEDELRGEPRRRTRPTSLTLSWALTKLICVCVINRSQYLLSSYHVQHSTLSEMVGNTVSTFFKGPQKQSPVQRQMQGDNYISCWSQSSAGLFSRVTSLRLHSITSRWEHWVSGRLRNLPPQNQ